MSTKFKKGNTIGKGRPKGSLNKSSERIRNAYAKLLEDNLDVIIEDVEQLDPKDRVRFFLDLSKYIIPTLKATEHNLPKEILKSFNLKNAIGFEEDKPQ